MITIRDDFTTLYPPHTATVVLRTGRCDDHSGQHVPVAKLSRYLINDNYSRNVRPVFNESRSTMVQLRMSLHQIIEMVGDLLYFYRYIYIYIYIYIYVLHICNGLFHYYVIT